MLSKEKSERSQKIPDRISRNSSRDSSASEVDHLDTHETPAAATDSSSADDVTGNDDDYGPTQVSPPRRGPEGASYVARKKLDDYISNIKLPHQDQSQVSC